MSLAAVPGHWKRYKDIAWLLVKYGRSDLVSGMRLENFDRALEYSRRALKVNPNMDSVRRNIDLIERLLEQRRKQMI